MWHRNAAWRIFSASLYVRTWSNSIRWHRSWLPNRKHNKNIFLFSGILVLCFRLCAYSALVSGARVNPPHWRRSILGYSYKRLHTAHRTHNQRNICRTNGDGVHRLMSASQLFDCWIILLLLLPLPLHLSLSVSLLLHLLDHQSHLSRNCGSGNSSNRQNIRVPCAWSACCV